MPYREDLEAALAHAEAAERELLGAREASAADHERIAELERQLAKAKRGVEAQKASLGEDDAIGRTRRAAERVAGVAKLAQSQVAASSYAERMTEQRFLMACSPSGWALDSATQVVTGLWTLFATGGLCGLSVYLLWGDLNNPPVALILMIMVVPFLASYLVPWLLARKARPAARRAAEAERRWIAELPFPARNVERAYTMSNDGLRVTVKFRDHARPVPTDRASELLNKAGMTGTPSDHFHALRLDAPHGLDRRAAEWKRARASRLLFHDIVGEVLLPLHEERAIDSVEL